MVRILNKNIPYIIFYSVLFLIPGILGVIYFPDVPCSPAVCSTTTTTTTVQHAGDGTTTDTSTYQSISPRQMRYVAWGFLIFGAFAVGMFILGWKEGYQ